MTINWVFVHCFTLRALCIRIKTRKQNWCGILIKITVIGFSVLRNLINKYFLPTVFVDKNLNLQNEFKWLKETLKEMKNIDLL